MRDKEDPPPERHESFGMLGLVNRSSTGTPLFGSDLLHSHMIAITLKSAERQFHLSQNWYYGREPIVEIEMSRTQFAEFITGAGRGDGVPVTIRYAKGKYMERPPMHNQMEMVKQTFKKKLDNIDGEFEGAIDSLKKIMEKPSIGKKDREEILAIVNGLRREAVTNLPFVKDQFDEACATTVNVAKMELEAHKDHIVNTLGANALKALNEGGPGPLTISMAPLHNDESLDKKTE